MLNYGSCGRRIRTVQATKKITQAMELIAASRIVKAQQRLNATLPYTQELNRALTAAASNASTLADHPLVAAQSTHERAAVLVITADRGLAGAYSSNAIREAQALSNHSGRRRLRASFPTSSVARARRGSGSVAVRSRSPGPASLTSRRMRPLQQIADAVLERVPAADS